MKWTAVCETKNPAPNATRTAKTDIDADESVHPPAPARANHANAAARDAADSHVARLHLADLLQLSERLFLIFAGKDDGVKVVNAEHAVQDDVTGHMRNMDVAVYIFRTLPLEDIKARRGRQDY